MDTLNYTLTEDFASEVWKAVPTLESLYSVSSCGRVRRDAPFPYHPNKQPGLLRQFIRGRYLSVNLYREPGNPIQRYIHHLVALAFIGNRPDGYEVNHIDGDKTNNYASNLEYVTRLQNRRHAIVNGLHVIGERHHACKVNDQVVREIRHRFSTEKLSRRFLASCYGISYSHLNSILRGTERKYVL